MRAELKLHRIILFLLVATVIAYIALALHLKQTLASERLEVVASLILIIAAAAALILMSLAEGVVAFEFGRRHRTEFLGYLSLALLSLGSGLYLSIEDHASLQTVSLIAAMFGVLFGLVQLRVGFHLGQHPAYRRMFLLNGSLELLLAGALAFGSRLSNERTAMMLVFVGSLSVLQVLPFLLYTAGGYAVQGRARDRAATASAGQDHRGFPRGPASRETSHPGSA